MRDDLFPRGLGAPQLQHLRSFFEIRSRRHVRVPFAREVKPFDIHVLVVEPGHVSDELLGR